jgi:hypothetical protein
MSTCILASCCQRFGYIAINDKHNVHGPIAMALWKRYVKEKKRKRTNDRMFEPQARKQHKMTETKAKKEKVGSSPRPLYASCIPSLHPLLIHAKTQTY